MRANLLPAVLLLLVGSACRASDSEPDLILLNARVYTLNWGEPDLEGRPATDAPWGPDGWHPDAEAVVIRGGRIAFVGSSAEARARTGPETVIRDLAGATVLPGFIDAHTHVAGLGRNLSQVDLRGVTTEDQAVARVVERAGGRPAGEWIPGWGWDEGAWANRYPTMDVLSNAFPDNPVVLRSLHGFATWGNRRAFEEAGITRDTPDPDGGTIVRGPNGTPSGILLNRAGDLLLDALPRQTPQQRMAEFHVGLLAMAEAGYVGVHEAGVDAATVQALEGLERGNDLPLRVFAMLSARDTGLLNRWIVRGPDADPERHLRIRSVKAFQDGALGSRGARLLADYSDRPGHRGVDGDRYGFDHDLLARAMHAGFQVAIHAIGDAGNREALDFLDSMIGAAPDLRALRHRIEHAQVVAPEDAPRFGRLGLIASMQPPHAVEDMTWAEDRLGADRIRGAYAWRTLRRQGAHLVFSSDLPGSDHDIFYGLHAAMTRRDRHATPPGGWHPEEAVSPEEAVRGYTSWAAWAGFVEDRTGVLDRGRWADLTVMDVDPFVVGSSDHPEALLEGHILLTVVGGRIVYDRTATADTPGG